MQRVLDVAWPRVAGGCHLARDTPAAIARAGFTLERCRPFGFRPSAPGLARRAARDRRRPPLAQAGRSGAGRRGERQGDGDRRPAARAGSPAPADRRAPRRGRRARSGRSRRRGRRRRRRRRRSVARSDRPVAMHVRGDAGRAGVARRVRERLGDDVVDRHLDRRRRPLGEVDAERDWDRAAAGEGAQRGRRGRCAPAASGAGRATARAARRASTRAPARDPLQARVRLGELRRHARHARPAGRGRAR